jgi:hypothetical protein
MSKVQKPPKRAPTISSAAPDTRKPGAAKTPAAGPVKQPSWLPGPGPVVCHEFPYEFSNHPTLNEALEHRYEPGVFSGFQYPNDADAAAHRNGEFIVWNDSGKVLVRVAEAELPAEARNSSTGGLSATVQDCRDFGRDQDLLEWCNHAMMAGTAKRLSDPPVALGAAEPETRFEHYTVATDADLERVAFAINGKIYLRERVPSKQQDTWYEIGADPAAASPIPALKEE